MRSENRDSSARRAPVAFVLAALLLIACAPEQVGYDLVLRGGRVMDPETGLDAVMDVGITGVEVRSISEEPLSGNEVVDVSGLVVAPGFVDLHAHGQDPFSRDLQVRDGVTAAFELEGGAYPVDEWYAERDGSWRIHFGATAAYGAARVLAFGEDERAATYEAASAEQVGAMQETLRDGLADGALGIGLPLQYQPGASRSEIFRMFQTAAEAGVTVFSHIRYAGVVEPESSIAAVQEMIADAAGSGASVHIVHIGSSGLAQMPTVKMTLAPARRLEDVAPAMRRKGRLSVGADADITVFDPETVIDRATFAEPALPSAGIPHVLVDGVFVVRDGELVEDALPGRGIRSGVVDAD